jgi:nitroreductase
LLKDLIIRNRTCRRFHQERLVPLDTLEELVDLARLAPSGHNRQGLKYVLVNQPAWNDRINDCLTWAGYIKGWKSPPEGEKPSAFIVMLRDVGMGPMLVQDQGFAGMCILLGAVERGLAGCFLLAVDKKRLSGVLGLGDGYEIEAVVAIGHPKEQIVLEEMGVDGDVRYWRDEQGVHHVPKRGLAEIILTIPHGEA